MITSEHSRAHLDELIEINRQVSNEELMERYQRTTSRLCNRLETYYSLTDDNHTGTYGDENGGGSSSFYEKEWVAMDK